MKQGHFYFNAHLTDSNTKDQLETSAYYNTLTPKNQEILDLLVKEYPEDGYQNQTPEEYCSDFYEIYPKELEELKTKKGIYLLKFLRDYLGLKKKWGATQYLYATGSNKKAPKLSEQDLIQEMTDDKKSVIKKLLDAADGDLSAVKPFLPAIIISLNTNTRNKYNIQFKHTGRFCFDIDKLKDSNEAREWLNKLWKGTKNIKPYMAFLSPRGKGVKVFCQVELNDTNFIKDFTSEAKESVMNHHKVWYLGATTELINSYPGLEDKIDQGTKDPQRLTYIPFIANKETDFKYDYSRISNYSKIVKDERKREKKKLKKKIKVSKKEVLQIMKEQNITNKTEAYYLLQRQAIDNFDSKEEMGKFIKVIDFITEESSKDARIEAWRNEKFTSYENLQKLSWVLFPVFGDQAIEQLKRLIPAGSNKLDENHNDYRWALRTKNDYSSEQLVTITPAAFYKVVRELPCGDEFISEHFEKSYENYKALEEMQVSYQSDTQNNQLLNAPKDDKDSSQFSDKLTEFANQNRKRLPLIETFENLKADVVLSPGDFLDKNVMHNLFQNKYADKKIFYLKSQCGK
jgi:hypothetical protein